MDVWELALRARASGTGAESEVARLALAELEHLRARVRQLQAELRTVRQRRPEDGS